MRRAFITLYALVVFSVLAFGWGLDKVWQLTAAGNTNQRPTLEAFSVLSYFVAETEPAQRQQVVTKLAQSLDADVSLLQLQDFAQTAFADKLDSGERAVIESGDSDKRYFQRLPGSDVVVSWRQQSNSRSALLYRTLLVVFYVSIAVAIFIWIWPLSRDLAKLERQTKHLGHHTTPVDVQVSPTSAVRDLAQAFNRMAQRVRDLLTTQKEMTYAVSHELRTPLARMKFGLEMASALDDVPRIREKLAGVREDVTEMDLLVNQLLAYAEFDQQERTLEVQPGELGALLGQLIERVQRTGSGSHVVIICEDELQGQPVYCEWYLMERALLNLLQNARRFAKSEVLVTIAEEHGKCQIIIDDDGPGVPEADRLRVFQSFVRLNNPVNSGARGFGLGLSIVQRITRWHNGSVRVEAAPSGGARFVLSWPLHGVESEL